ncbi:hypothetical protein S7335_5214 [Synechococcus sp. PCC 7335]|uniref:hypothetical protein n=1 Tax=Synechococcus sp. (strain ATCC 29403 / PCC 7335) TaxID=91464 RepID=UPI00017EB8D7|nr:hypothetical protein [Synechococcus sp. PCC 7335]EDX87504.1 hypothetical protein S7335_5214 [Synechococcus sp. PCC 7335]
MQPIRPVQLSMLIASFLAFAISVLLGSGMATAIDTGRAASTTNTLTTANTSYGMVDPINSRLEASYRIYLNECATCHVALPPAVLPTQTWQHLVVDSEHYGLTLSDITAFEKQLIINYLQAYSRPHKSSAPTPFRLFNSDYFQALHPQVNLPQPLNLLTCTSCHLSATTQNYRDIISNPNR